MFPARGIFGHEFNVSRFIGYTVAVQETCRLGNRDIFSSRDTRGMVGNKGGELIERIVLLISIFSYEELGFEL